MQEDTLAIKMFILTVVGEDLRRQRKTAEDGAREAHKDTLEAESRMKTRYDSTRTERAWLADAQQRRINELDRHLNILTGFKLAEKQLWRVGVGALIQLIFGPEELWYMVLPVAGGLTVEVPELQKSVTIITPVAPIYGCLEGKGAGTSVIIDDKDFTVTRVC